MTTRAQILTDTRSLELHAASWKRLWLRQADADVFTSLEWIRASWAAYGGGKSLAVILVQDNENVIGILPFAVETGVVRFAAAPRSDYNDILCEPGRERDVISRGFSALRNLPSKWHRCELDNIPQGAKLLRFRRELQLSARAHACVVAGGVCPRTVLTSAEVGSAILRKKSLRRHTNQLNRLGNVEFRHLTNRDEIKKALPQFFEQHIARRSIAGGRSLFSTSEGRAFFTRLVDELDPRQELRFAALTLDGRAVAFHFGFQAKSRLIWYKPSFDVNLFDVSPGEVLLRHLFRYAVEEKLDVFDFTIGNEPFKERFANELRQNYRLNIFKKGVSGCVAAVTLKAKERLKSHPRSFRAFKRMSAGLAGRMRRANCRIRDEGPLRSGWESVRRAFGAVVYHSSDTLIYQGDSCQASFFGQDGNGVVTQVATFADVAVLAAHHLSTITPQRLSEARVRCKCGDTVYVCRRFGRCVLVAWTCTRDTIRDGFSVDRKSKSLLERPALTVYDCWTPPGADRENAVLHFFGEVQKQAWNAGVTMRICCNGDDHEMKKWLEGARFSLKVRLRHTRWCGAWERKSARAFGES